MKIHVKYCKYFSSSKISLNVNTRHKKHGPNYFTHIAYAKGACEVHKSTYLAPRLSSTSFHCKGGNQPEREKTNENHDPPKTSPRKKDWLRKGTPPNSARECKIMHKLAMKDMLHTAVYLPAAFSRCAHTQWHSEEADTQTHTEPSERACVFVLLFCTNEPTKRTALRYIKAGAVCCGQRPKCQPLSRWTVPRR